MLTGTVSLVSLVFQLISGTISKRRKGSFIACEGRDRRRARGQEGISQFPFLWKEEEEKQLRCQKVEGKIRFLPRVNLTLCVP